MATRSSGELNVMAKRRASWLFGTIHVSDPRVTALNAEARKAFDGQSAWSLRQQTFWMKPA